VTFSLKNVGRPSFESLFPLTRNVARVSDVEPLGHDSVKVAGLVGEDCARVEMRGHFQSEFTEDES
jgi:hypothetical protein